MARVLALLSLLSACATSGSVGRPVRYAELTGKVWVLRQLDGARVNRIDSEAVTVRFLPDHGIVGTSVCNDVGGEQLTWSAVSSGAGVFRLDKTGATIITVVGCQDTSAAQLGDRFWAKMIDARAWSVTMTILTIRFSDGSTAALEPV